MIAAGVDIGSMSAKAVILDDGVIRSWTIIPTGPDSADTARQVMDRALELAGLRPGDVGCLVSTGYGRVNVPFARRHVTEISCHARGASWLFPEARTVLDMGGQDCKAIKIDAKGKVLNFVMNDKCAAGTGRYLERIAAALELPLDRIGPLSLKPVEGPATISSSCAVFAEGDVLRLLRQGQHVNDILAGASVAITKRIRLLLDRVGVAEALVISGGIAKNVAVVTLVEQSFGLKARIAPEPQIVGALGAALFARDTLLTGSGHA
ncbi:MAG: acyl-CoA dehydratase activase [Dehalococcoidia bacterium]|nr:acyl-CoA dehydratase activase [Dehalococcoidia bacterium]